MKRILFIFAAILAMAGCIDNDLPYPVIVPHITSLDVEDAEQVHIDHDRRIVTVYFPETKDLRTVSVRSVAIDQDIAAPSMEIVGVHDLTSPLKVNLRTYQDYTWTIAAVRNVERYFTVQGQVGSSVIDPQNHRAVAMVGKYVDISNINVTSLKLGPREVSSYSLEPSQMKDFTHGITVDVTAFDQTDTWELFVEVTDGRIEISKINPWAYDAYLTFVAEAGRKNGLKYRMKGDEQWIETKEGDITADGGTFVCHIKGLLPDTAYEAVAYSGSTESTVAEFMTEPVTPIPNGSFEYASKVSGKDYYKFYDPSCGIEDGMYMFWGSGNGEGSEGVSGSANMGIVITYIDTEDKVDGNQSVRAQTSQMAGMLAAGNLFTGQFAGLVGTSGGKVNFGRPWSTRPVALKLYCKYVTGYVDIINKMPAGVSVTKDDHDMAEIKVAIGNWSYKTYGGTQESPVHVNTTDANTFVDFNTDPATIANGCLILHHDGYELNGADKVSDMTGAWKEYVIPLNYHTMEDKPTHIIISCAASRYGDYFTGCSSSKLWLDAVELIYE